MKQTKQISLIIIILLSFNDTFAQWTKVNSVPTNDIVALTINKNRMYAASDSSEIYVTSDFGTSWTTLKVSNSPVDITSIIFFNNKIYAGTFRSGIFSSPDDGSSWEKSNSGPLSISGFALKDNILYASTFGSGVAVLDTNTNRWSFINDSLPSYSINVQGIIGSPNFLIIAAGANGTFYKYNFSTRSWDERFYDGKLRPGLIIDNLINISDTIFALNGSRIIKSSNAGESWSDDVTGTHKGFYRTIYAGSKSQYLLTNTVTQDLIPTGTWIQKRDIYSNTGSTWSTNEEFLPGGYSYDIIEYGNKLFLGREDGLYVKDIVSGITEKTKNNSFRYYLYPNPSTGGIINVGGDKNIIKVEIFNVLGQLVFKTLADKFQFRFQHHLPNGMYFLRLNFKDDIRTIKMIILK